MSDINQSAGDDSENYQAGRDIHINGVSATEARNIAIDVFKANFPELSRTASEIALSRVETMTEKLVDRYFKEIPQHQNKLQNPAVQSSIYQAQIEYAKTGDKELEERLLEILIRRIDADERSLKQIVLDETIKVIPKLTNDQVNLLTLICIKYLNYPVKSISTFQSYINLLASLVPSTEVSDLSYAHLQYTGCCTVMGEGQYLKPLADVLKYFFKGIFSSGFTEDEFKVAIGRDFFDQKTNLIRTCLHDPENKLQFNALTVQTLEHILNENGLEAYQKQCGILFEKSTMSQKQIDEYVIGINPKMKELIEEWSRSQFKTLNLTSVGFAIATINYNKITGLKLDIAM